MRQIQGLYLVCYDIRGEGHEKRLRRVYRAMRGYGQHMQFSVFLCAITPMQLAEMEGELEQLIDHSKDQILIAPMGPADKRYGRNIYTLGLPLIEREKTVHIF